MAVFIIAGLFILGLCFTALFFTNGLLRVSLLILAAVLVISAVFVIDRSPVAKKILRLALDTNESDSLLLTEEYFLSGHDEVKSYSIDPQIEGFYTLLIFSDFDVIPREYDFRGALEIRVLENQKVVSEEIITKSARRYYREDAHFYKSVILEEFMIPSKRESEPMTLKLKVLEADKSAPLILDHSKVFIKVQYSKLL